MKTNSVLITLFSSMVLLSCGESKSELEKFQEDRKALVTEMTALQTQIDDLDKSIEELDTTVVEESKKISTLVVTEEVFEHYFEIQGGVEADKNVIVVPEVGGLISQMYVEEGQKVTAGQSIARINSDVLASNMKELEEQLELAKYMYEKQKSLLDQGVGTEVAYKQAEGQYNTLQQTVKSLKTQQGKFVLKAPFDGYVEEVFTVKGQMAGPTSPIIRLISLKKMSVKADISEAYLKGIDNNSAAQLRFPALGDEVLTGLTLKRIGKFVNPINRTISVEVEIPNPTEKHIPNLMSVLQIRDFVDSTALVVPTSIIRKDMESPCVYVVRGSSAIKTEVELGRSSGDFTIIKSGISKGDILVDKGLRGLKKDTESIKID